MVVGYRLLMVTTWNDPHGRSEMKTFKYSAEEKSKASLFTILVAHAAILILVLKMFVTAMLTKFQALKVIYLVIILMNFVGMAISTSYNNLFVYV